MNKDLHHFLEVIVIASVLFIATVYIYFHFLTGSLGATRGCNGFHVIVKIKI